MPRNHPYTICLTLPLPKSPYLFPNAILRLPFFRWNLYFHPIFVQLAHLQYYFILYTFIHRQGLYFIIFSSYSILYIIVFSKGLRLRDCYMSQRSGSTVPAETAPLNKSDWIFRLQLNAISYFWNFASCFHWDSGICQLKSPGSSIMVICSFSKTFLS